MAGNSNLNSESLSFWDTWVEDYNGPYYMPHDHLFVGFLKLKGQGFCFNFWISRTLDIIGTQFILLYE